MKSMTHGNQLDFDIRIQELVKSKNEILEENETLRNEIAELQNIIKKKGEKRITANKQLLILHYLNIFEKIKFTTKEKKYRLLHLIIDKTPQTVKEFFINIEQPETDKYNEIFSEENLYFVSDLFNDVGLKDEANKVNSKMIELKI